MILTSPKFSQAPVRHCPVHPVPSNISWRKTVTWEWPAVLHAAGNEGSLHPTTAIMSPTCPQIMANII